MDRGGRREGGKWERVWSTGYRRFNLRAMGPVTIWDSGDTGEVIDYHGTDLSPPSSLFFFFLPLSFSLSFSAFLSPPLHLPPPHSPLSFSLFLSWPPYPRSFEPTPKFIPGGWYGDAPSSEWRQGIQRRRELWNEKYMVSKRTALGRSSKVEEKSGEGERRTRSSQRKESVQGRGSGCEKVRRERKRERIRGEKDPTRARVSLPRIFERENRILWIFETEGQRLMPRYIHVLRCRWPVVGQYCRQTVGCLMTNDRGSLSFERPTPGVISVISRPRDLENRAHVYRWFDRRWHCSLVFPYVTLSPFKRFRRMNENNDSNR